MGNRVLLQDHQTSLWAASVWPIDSAWYLPMVGLGFSGLSVGALGRSMVLMPQLDWAEASCLALSTLFPAVVWHQLLKLIQRHADLAAQFGFGISLKRLPHWPFRDCCKI